MSLIIADVRGHKCQKVHFLIIIKTVKYKNIVSKHNFKNFDSSGGLYMATGLSHHLSTDTVSVSN